MQSLKNIMKKGSKRNKKLFTKLLSAHVKKEYEFCSATWLDWEDRIVLNTLYWTQNAFCAN